MIERVIETPMFIVFVLGAVTSCIGWSYMLNVKQGQNAIARFIAISVPSVIFSLVVSFCAIYLSRAYFVPLELEEIKELSIGLTQCEKEKLIAEGRAIKESSIWLAQAECKNIAKYREALSNNN